MVLRLKKNMTASEYERIADDLSSSELVRGEVVFLMAGAWDHSQITALITIVLGTWAMKSKRGRVLTGEAGIVTQRDPDTVRGVDVAYFSFRRLPADKTPPGFSKIPPELAVEIVGKGQGWQTMVAKAGEYLEMGVDRVWIVEPKTKRIHVYQADAEPAVYGVRDTISDAKILPGLSCRVRDCFGM